MMNNKVGLSKDQMEKINALAGVRPGVNIGLTGTLEVKKGSDMDGPLAEVMCTDSSIKSNS